MANCRNCSAPLPADAIVCAYCGTRADIDLQGIHEFTVNAPQSQRACPRCRKPLQTLDLNVQGAFLVERCAGCMGLFFDPGELEALLDHSVKHVYQIDSARLGLLEKHQRRDEYGVAYIPCPVCGALMNRVGFGARSGVVVDRCRDHGVWLDGGELRQLMEWTRAGGQLYHQEVQKRKAQEEQRQKERKEREKLYQAVRTSDGSHSVSLATFGRASRRFDSDEDLLGLLSRAAGWLLK
jgi:Zn-finger nucleic acid-binding protein